MRGAPGKTEVLIGAVAVVVVASVLAAVAVAVEPPVPVRALVKGQYRLPAEALGSLPSAIALEKQLTPAAGTPTRRGVQFFQSPGGVFGMFLLSGPQQAGGRLFFPVGGLWTFLPDKRFEQRDAKGNRLILGNGKAQVFNANGIQFGALQDPALGVLYQALLRLTM